MTIRRSPWPQLDVLQQEMNRLFDGYPGNGTRRAATYPPVNLWQGTDGVALAVSLPGYQPEHVEITTTGNTVTIKGHRPVMEMKEGQVRVIGERHTGEFLRSFELPFDVDAERTTATFRNGILMVSLARPEQEKPRKIQIKVGQ